MKYHLIILVGIILTGCSGSNKTEKTFTSYTFIFYDSTATDTVAFGNIKLGKLKQKTEGFYSIYKNNSALPFVSDTSAKLDCTYDDVKKSIWLNMNPKLADNNIFVTAEIKSDILEGDWVYSTMKGIKDKGKFYAKKN